MHRPVRVSSPGDCRRQCFFRARSKAHPPAAVALAALAPPQLTGATSVFEANSRQVLHGLLALHQRSPLQWVEFIDYTGLGAATLRARGAGAFPAGVLLTVRVHGTMGSIDAVEGVALDEVRRHMHAEEAYALQQADAVMVPTEGVGLDYANRYGIDPTKLVVSPPPMALLLDGFEARARLPDPLHFLFYGKLQEVKGCDILAEAAVSLILSEPERGWRFTFVGRDTFCTAHRRMVSDCLAAIIPSSCATRFEFVGQIPRETLVEICATVAAAVVPSRSESFCLAAHELRALGLPLIVPGRAPFLEYFRPETGCLNFDGSAESLAVALKRFADDRSLRQQLAARPRPTYPTFDVPYRELRELLGRTRVHQCRVST